jgi:Glycosyl transferase family 2
MNAPLVSICLPNLNTRSYLQERVDSIFRQSFANWEMVVSDNFSDDGAWEFFEELARKDRRVSIAQAPREGLYSNWNNCLRRARGEYVYIATSDDSMAEDCIEKLVMALEEQKDCDLAHCRLVIVDDTGAASADTKWPDCTMFRHGLEEDTNGRHLRRAPSDGLLHLVGEHVVLSITQLLIRRSLFSRTGLFESKWGSVGDFNWEMKAGLVANMVHVPDTWATWRIHSTQATAAVDLFSPERSRKIDEMIEDAVSVCTPYMQPEIVSGLKEQWLPKSREMRAYYAALRNRKSAFSRRVHQLRQLCGGGEGTRSEVLGRLRRRPKWGDVAPTQMRSWLESLGITPVVKLPA